MTASERVVITGASTLSPLGCSWAQTAAALQNGVSGIDLISAFDASAFPVQLAGEVRGWFQQTQYPTRIHAMLDETASNALTVSGLMNTNANLGLFISVGKQPPRIEDIGTQIDLDWENAREYEGPVSDLAIRRRCHGPVIACYTACASGNDAVGLALDALRRGDAEVVLCGGADAQIGPIPLLEFAKLRVLATPADNRTNHPRPFDRDRSGFVLGEGAAVFVLETLEHAIDRRAPIMAELLGYGCAVDTYSLTRSHPSAAGAVRAMKAALEDAQLGADAVDYVNAHGTGTIANDAVETEALKRVFGNRARMLPISSTKSMSGHLLAAAGAVELAYCLMALEHQFIPPTINYGNADPSCDLDYVPNHSREARLNVVMSNAFGFGGQNSCLIVKRFE